MNFELTVSRILHAGYVFEAGGTRLVFDPIFENPFGRNCFAFPDVRFDHRAIRRERFDAVFISHYHDDHCSMVSLDLIDRATPVFLFCVHEEMFALIRRLGFADVNALRLDRAVRIGAFTVTPRRAFDADVDAIFEVEAAGRRLLNVVDALIDDDVAEMLAARAPWDLVLWPFQSLRERAVLAPTMADAAETGVAPEFLAQIRALAPRTLVPSSCQFRHESWSWLNHALFPVSYARFADDVRRVAPDTWVRRLDPGEALGWTQAGPTAAPGLAWVLPVATDPVEYAFDPRAIPPSTAEIARRLPAPADPGRVRAFLADELPARLRRLEFGPDGYFARPRVWRLSVYDHEGRADVHHLRVGGGGAARLPAPAAPEWTTEIAAGKLYAALAEGEALTSLYLRVNDGPFGAEVRRGLGDADVLEDPLIGLLYAGGFAAFQRAQMRLLNPG